MTAGLAIYDTVSCEETVGGCTHKLMQGDRCRFEFDPNVRGSVSVLNQNCDTVRQFAHSHILRWTGVFNGIIAAGCR